MTVTDQQVMALFTVVVGTLDDTNPIGGISQPQRAHIIQSILNGDVLSAPAPDSVSREPEDCIEIPWKPNLENGRVPSGGPS